MSEPIPAEFEALAWMQGLKYGAPSALVRLDFEFGGKPASFKRCHDRTFAQIDVSPLETMPPPACPGVRGKVVQGEALVGEPPPVPDITAEEARARVKEFAGVEPVITATAKWMPGQAAPHVIWRVRIYAAHPADLETGGLTLTGAIEQLRVAVADTPGWRQRS